jgi:hypothetical protein
VNFLLLAVVVATLNAFQATPAEGALEVAEVRACEIELTPLGAQVSWGGPIFYDLVADNRGAVIKLSRRDDARSKLSSFVRIERLAPLPHDDPQKDGGEDTITGRRRCLCRKTEV